MHLYLQNIAIIAYVCAMGLALAHLVQRQALVHRLALLATLVGWIAHTLALVVLAIEIGGPPLLEDWASPHLDLVARREGLRKPLPALLDLAQPG